MHRMFAAGVWEEYPLTTESFMFEDGSPLISTQDGRLNGVEVAIALYHTANKAEVEVGVPGV